MKKITVDAKAFADAMNKVSKVLRKSPLPILEEVAVRIQDDRCTLTATDMETWRVAVDEELNRIVGIFKLAREQGYTLKLIPGTPEENAPVFDFENERIIRNAA